MDAGGRIELRQLHDAHAHANLTLGKEKSPGESSGAFLVTLLPVGASVLMGSHPWFLTRFVNANRRPPRIKCGAGFRCKTLPLFPIGAGGDFSASLSSARASFLSLADIFLSASTSAICALMTASAPTYFLV